MSVPQTREEFSDHCMRRLGWPVIEINIDQDQIDDRVDEALDFYRQFNFDATETTYYKHVVTQDDINNGWIPIDESIIGIVRIFPINTQLFSNNMFSYNYQFALNDLPSLTGGQMSNYVITMQYLATIEKLLVGEKPVRFNKLTGKLYIDMKWGTDVVVGQYIIAEATQILDETDYPSIWSDRMLQKYATALIKKQWGSNAKKYSGVQLPGGITVNGQQIFDEAVAEIEDIEEEMKTTWQLPPSMLIF